jgi:hypothetical protein
VAPNEITDDPRAEEAANKGQKDARSNNDLATLSANPPRGPVRVHALETRHRYRDIRRQRERHEQTYPHKLK